MLHHKARTDLTLSIRPAGAGDVQAMSRLLDQGQHVHLHPDWRPATDWIGRAPAFVAEDRRGLAACLVTPADPPPAAWLRAAAVRHGVSAAEAMHQLFSECLPALAAQDIATLSVMGADPWIAPTLVRSGFAIVEEVESWIKPDLHCPAARAKDVVVGSARREDVAQLARLDQSAFAPRWRLSGETLALAWSKAATFTVAIRDAEIIGYQLSLTHGTRAHLGRLVVHPAEQRSGVGAHLLADALERYTALGLDRVSLNTQSDNLPSHALYRAFGFRSTGAPVAVWERTTAFE